MSQSSYLRRVGLAALLIAIIVAAPSITASRASAADSQGKNSVTVIRYFANRGDVEAFEMADAMGWFKDKRIRIDAVGFSESGPENLVALASGSVDVAGIATPPLINAMTAGAKIIGVMPGEGVNKTVRSKFFVLADSPIKTPQDLKDKSIAVNTLGAHLDYTTRVYLGHHGLSRDDVQLIAVPGPQLDQVLRHKQAEVVAVGGWQTIFAGKIEAERGVRVLFTDYDVLGDITLGNLAMKQAFIKTHLQAVKDFVTVSAKAADWSVDHPDAAKKLFAQILAKRGDNPALAQYWAGYGLRPHALFTAHDAQFWIDMLTREGRLKPGQLTPEDVETNSYNGFAKKLAQRRAGTAR